MTRQQRRAAEARERKVKEMASVGVVDLWADCARVFGKQPPPAVAIFGRILDKLIATATAKGLSD